MMPGESRLDQPQASPERSRELFEQREYLQGLTEWFTLPVEDRDTAIDKAIQAGLDAPDDYLPHVLGRRDDEEGALDKRDHWVLTNFAILTSPTTEALLNPNTHDPLVLDGRNDFNDYTASCAQEHFTELVDLKRQANIARLQEEQGITKGEARRQTPRLTAGAGEAADFQAPNEFIRRRFSVEEMSTFINNVLDKTPLTDDLTNTLGVYDLGVIDVAQHQELILDDALMNKLLRRHNTSLPEYVNNTSLGDLTANSLRLNGALPSIGLVEKYMNLKPDDLESGSFTCYDLDGTSVQVPHGAVYMGLIRRLMYNKDDRGKDYEPYEDALLKVTDYLSSESFTAQLMPYVASDAKFNDVLWRGQGSPRLNGLGAFKDRQPQDVKRQWLQEVVDVVVAHLVEIGDEEKAELVLENTK